MRTSKIKYSVAATLLLFGTLTQATSLKEVVEQTMVKNPEIMSIMKNDEAFKYYVDEEEGGYYPRLDVTAYVAAESEEEDPDNAAKTDLDDEGYRVQADLEQLLYDGGNTPARIEEAEKKYSSNELRNKNRIENIMFESITAYLDMVKADEKRLLAKENIAIHDEYMATAKQTEEISGESLNRIEVSSKIHFAKNRLYEEDKNKQISVSNFEKSVGMSPEGFVCRPNVDANLIPSNKKMIIENILKNNYEIMEQIDNIQQQRAVLNQSKSEFLPTIKFKAQALTNEDLLNSDAETNIYSGRVELTYNLFNGTKDTAVKEREMLFLQESQQTLDTISSDVVDKASVAYERYQISMKQIDTLKMYISDNKEILALYQDQFDGGTREFIDVLNAETDIYNANLALVDSEYEMMSAYYELFSLLSNLSSTVMASKDQVCQEMKLATRAKVSRDESMEDLKMMMDDEAKVEKVAVAGSANAAAINKAMMAEFEPEISSGVMTYNEETMSLRLSNEQLLKNTYGVNLIPAHKKIIKNAFPRLVNVARMHEEKIAGIRVEGHSSSVYKGAATKEAKFEKNKAISYARAQAVLSEATSSQEYDVQKNMQFIRDKFSVHGMSSANTIKNADGSENGQLSKRVEFVIVPK